MNRIDIVGNFTKDPDIIFTKTQKTMTFFCIAENVYDRKTKERHGQFFNAVAYGKRGETIADHFSKGDKIKVGGHMEHVQYNDNKGDHDFWRIVVDDFDFCSPKKAD